VRGRQQQAEEARQQAEEGRRGGIRRSQAGVAVCGRQVRVVVAVQGGGVGVAGVRACGIQQVVQ